MIGRRQGRVWSCRTRPRLRRLEFRIVSPTRMQDLADRIKQKASRLGFSPVGITTAEPPPHLDFYANWLEQGFHGEMGYLATERARTRRADPREILPECQSVLVLGFPYAPSKFAEEPARPARGRVASYAWGVDYHDVLGEKLAELTAFIEKAAGRPVPNRYYVDTGPVLEREFAQRAGLGWIGKNTCLIHPKKGSYFFLAEILLGLPLSPDPPFTTDHCGTCTRCIDACPTGCILPDRTLDGSRCISYLTIELKGPIPPELRPQMGGWIFGCDICQQVCPWNIRFAVESGHPALESDPELGRPILVDELGLDPEAFNRKFKGSPVKRSKRRGYLRNVVVALGNSGSPEAIPHLAETLQSDPEPLVRGAAAWALGEIGGVEAAEHLREASVEETDSTVLAEIGSALER